MQTQHRSSIPVQPLAEEQPGAARPVDLRCLMKAAGNGLWRSSNADKTEEVLRVIDLASVNQEDKRQNDGAGVLLKGKGQWWHGSLTVTDSWQ